jgi:hypothetical protein
MYMVNMCVTYEYAALQQLTLCNISHCPVLPTLQYNSVHTLCAVSSQVITTRSFEDRLETIANVRNAGISVCCGGILGLGEGEQDR